MLLSNSLFIMMYDKNLSLDYFTSVFNDDTAVVGIHLLAVQVVCAREGLACFL